MCIYAEESFEDNRELILVSRRKDIYQHNISNILAQV